MPTDRNSRGALFYILLGAICVVPMALCVLASRNAFDTETCVVYFFIALFVAVAFSDLLLVYNPKGDNPKKDKLAVAFAVLTGISVFGLAAAFFLLFVGGQTWATVLFALFLSLLCHLVPGFLVWQIFVGSQRVSGTFRAGDSQRQDGAFRFWKEGASQDGGAGGSGLDKWIASLDPTKDYYGKHGEFARNDDSWGSSEYIRQFHNADPGCDLSDHFDWQEITDAETDGFLDDDK